MSPELPTRIGEKRTGLKKLSKSSVRSNRLCSMENVTTVKLPTSRLCHIPNTYDKWRVSVENTSLFYRPEAPEAGAFNLWINQNCCDSMPSTATDWTQLDARINRNLFSKYFFLSVSGVSNVLQQGLNTADLIYLARQNSLTKETALTARLESK
ncbi:hypothetical protein RUM43_009770 [Polyplax serrata]|uniref:Uncharacterized protein n=1 Tax=Polyplax serrata TaxID=468196 RepID=A0AAN8S7N7_POLSC